MSPETQSPRDDERRPLLATTQNGQASRRKDLLQSARKEGTHALMAALTCSYSNVLLPCVPLGLMAGGWGWPPAAVFVLNFLAMLPLASILTFGTEQLAAIVGISALREDEISIVQSSMIGSILSSILLILGTCFLLAGLGKKSVDINIDVAGVLTSLMIISCVSLIMPSALHMADPNGGGSNDHPSEHVLLLSRITAVILLLFYLIYLYFQSVTHADLFSEEEDQPEDKLHGLSSSIILVLATLGVSFCSDALVDSVDGFVEALGVSRSFIGLIIVPIVGNAGCLVGTVQWSRSDRVNLAVSVIVGATLQISLFVTPFLIVVGWIMGKPMSLQFDTFETIVLTMSTLVVNCIVHDGSTNYFEGLLLVSTYVIIGIAFFVHPDAVATSS
ncbi:calcium/proton exchangerprotein [Metarhizium robertsii]|uniref:Vacuolar calcium ion transporter n=1 Tax=Metarhizium robertsii TaxID=568076 RepID=A0A014PK54_9HYPO|nr:calcium/proton exchangerprotein [Metarhizium robertsii]